MTPTELYAVRERVLKEVKSMEGHSSLAIANEFLSRAQNGKRNLTNMQLQKLVYLAHGWNLAVNNSSLIQDDVEAWEYGPVIRRLYDALKRYGSGPVSRLIRWGDDTPFPSDDGEDAIEHLQSGEIGVIDAVWNQYGHFQAFQLSALTHANDSPWSATFKRFRNGVISPSEIKAYFQQLAALQR